MTIAVSLDWQPIEVQGNIALTTVWVPPVPGEIDTSFDQWSGFNKQVFWVAEYWDEYVFWWDNGTNYYSAYKWVSSINSNKISPFFRVRKDNKLPDTTSILWGNLDVTSSVNLPFAVWWGFIYIVWWFALYWNSLSKNIIKLKTTDMSPAIVNSWNWIPTSWLIGLQVFYAGWKIFFWWTFASTFNWGTSTRLQVINDDFTVDTTLTNFFLPSWAITCVFEQADGKVVISWGFTTIWWTTQNRIVRYNTDWTVDTTFTTNVWTWPSSWAIDIRQLSDWKLVLWWAFTTFNGTASQRVIVLNTDWTIATAVASGFNTGQVNSIAIDWSDNIFCWWTFTNYAWTWRVALAKLSSTLTLDTTYNAVINSWNVYSVFIDWTILYIWCDSNKTSNGSAVSGIFSTDLVNWTLSDNFEWGININWAPTNIRKIFVDSDYIYLYWATNFTTYWNNRWFDWEFTQCISFVDKQGTLNTNLDKFYNTTWTFNINYALKDGDDLYTTTSSNNGYWLSTSRWVVKFTAKSLDSTYIATITSAVVSAIYDNGLVVWWTFTSPTNRIVKLDSTGWVDATFNVETGFNWQVDRITKLSDWNYLVTWNFTTYKWVTTNRICLLDNLGTKIWTFVEWTGLSSNPLAKTLELSNGNYLVYGNFTTYKWVACNSAIILDQTWTQVAWLSSNFSWRVRKAVEHNGKVYFTWEFTTFGATTVNRIACIDLATWTLENIFWTGLIATTNIVWNDLIIDNWGKLLVVWNFTTYNWTPVGNVARIFI